MASRTCWHSFSSLRWFSSLPWRDDDEPNIRIKISTF
jgi:hypothetical protein